MGLDTPIGCPYNHSRFYGSCEPPVCGFFLKCFHWSFTHFFRNSTDHDFHGIEKPRKGCSPNLNLGN